MASEKVRYLEIIHFGNSFSSNLDPSTTVLEMATTSLIRQINSLDYTDYNRQRKKILLISTFFFEIFNKG